MVNPQTQLDRARSYRAAQNLGAPIGTWLKHDAGVA